MRPLPLLVIITIAAAEISDKGTPGSSLITKHHMKDWWNRIKIRTLPVKTIPEDLRNYLYQILVHYSKLSSLRRNRGKIQGLSTKIYSKRRKQLGRPDAKTNQSDVHTVKRALMDSFMCPSGYIKSSGGRCLRPEVFDYDY